MRTDFRLKHYMLDHEGEVIWTYDVYLWAEWIEWAPRHVADEMVGPYRVSTIFIGCDMHAWRGPPLLWETMVFATNGWQDRWMARASSVQHARLQHKIGCWRAKGMCH